MKFSNKTTVKEENVVVSRLQRQLPLKSRFAGNLKVRVA
jgi:hypothetical protein